MNRGHLAALLVVPLFSLPLLMPPAQDKAPPKQKAAAYHTGRKIDPVAVAAARKASVKKYAVMLKALPKATEVSWDWRDKGVVPPVVNQGQCGSCWDFSACGVLTSALIKAGYGKPDGSFHLSEQAVLDCQSNGGCEGDDNINPISVCKTTGIPTRADYGPYAGGPGRCKSLSGMKLYKIADWGFCTTSDQYGLAATQDIKNCMKAYGPIGAAIAADNAFMNVRPGEVFAGRDTRINHDIILVGWHDDPAIKSGGYWILRNSWGADWCDGGYCKIAYGANQVGTEAVWVTATPLPVPPQPPEPPVPDPPGPDMKGLIDGLFARVEAKAGPFQKAILEWVRTKVIDPYLDQHPNTGAPLAAVKDAAAKQGHRASADWPFSIPPAAVKVVVDGLMGALERRYPAWGWALEIARTALDAYLDAQK